MPDEHRAFPQCRRRRLARMARMAREIKSGRTSNPNRISAEVRNAPLFDCRR
jgi:hypothetical protein